MSVVLGRMSVVCLLRVSMRLLDQQEIFFGGMKMEE